MEDDDGEASNTESQVLTDSESLKIHHNSTPDPTDFFSDEERDDEDEDNRDKNVVAIGKMHDDDDDDDDSDEEEEEEEEEEIYPENFPTRLPNPMSHPVFKGFKSRLSSPEKPVEKPVASNECEERREHNPRREKITEYAQYLGLQPAVKSNKCSKCNAVNSNRNQGKSECLCESQVSPIIIPESTPLPPAIVPESVPVAPVIVPESSPVAPVIPQPLPIPPAIPESPPSHPVPSPSDNRPSTSTITNNFRITRKVYLCAACGTYFENWNLFLHMREIHKRHICLFCLGMFGQAERLSHHLEKKHNVTETTFESVEDFYNVFKGSCYLICCSCEKVFVETDNFYNHFCPTPSSSEKLPEQGQVCSICRQSGSHSITCQRQSDVHSSVLKSRSGKLKSKNNRIKGSEKLMLTSYQKKLTQLYERKMSLKTERKSLELVPSEQATCSTNNSATAEISTNVGKATEQSKLSRDTVAEIIMQVSKISDNADIISKQSEQVEMVDAKPAEPVGELEKPDKTAKDNWDSVTETIMRVSRLNNTVEQTEDVPGDRLIEKDSDKMLVDDHKEPDAVEDTEKRNELSSDDADDNENNEHHDNEEDEEEEVEEEDEDEKLKKLESTPMSVSKVNRAKGSLVIKICTNKNSHYSVSTPSMNGVDESEDNNNESDSDNDRLTVALSEENKPERVDTDEASVSHFDGFVDGKIEESSGLQCGETKLDNCSFTEEASQVNQQIDKVERIAEKFVGADNIPLAGEDIPSIDLNVDGLLESLKIVDLLKGCIEAASPTCVYCNHARHIAVDGKQLALHMLAEHRFQPQHPAVIIEMEQFVNRVKKSIDELTGHYFNADSYDSDIGTYNVPPVRIYECFNCRVVSHIHKDLYLHNRKMHQKTILICVMCKSTFYNYSELLCHLCPGIYSATATDMTNQSLTSAIVNSSIKYRCCICTIDPLPSAFRLMVHLRKRHHACDVCLELNGNQQRLSGHVWKHKLHHLCYRCGIAYRNKPDITKHLFWKHGTESVLCKKCLQKKWPHIYHFCIPPSAFVCEECNLSFSKAVALKVHKRLHAKEEPYACTECQERFISKKLMIRHEEEIHRPPPEPPEPPAPVDNVCENNADTNGNPQDAATLVDSLQQKCNFSEHSPNGTTCPPPHPPPPPPASSLHNQTPAVSPTCSTSGPSQIQPETSHKVSIEPVRKVVDVYDLPPLNLSSDSDSDDNEDDKVETTLRDEEKKCQGTDVTDGIVENSIEDKSPEIIADEGSSIESSNTTNTSNINNESEQADEQQEQQVDIMNGIWDNFKSYATTTETNLEELAKSEEKIIEAKQKELVAIIAADHDYCVIYGDMKMEIESEQIESSPKSKDVEEEGVNITENPVNEPDQAFVTEVTIDAVNEISIAVAESDGENKKEKSPKKKSANSNSSSSDSSSDSDSSSCSCGTNCSCSSSSSNSSSSSSSSSDSDSSASESSPKKQSDNRKRERKKTKNSSQHKRSKDSTNEHEEGVNNLVTEVGPAEELINVHTIEEPTVNVSLPYEMTVPGHVNPPVEKRFVMRESDLDTDETETDEDFYDEHPQELANKLLAEKRNQLMMLASVAAPSESSMSSGLNNGMLESKAQALPSQTSGKKKIKVKKRKKTSESRSGARGARGARGTRGRRPKYPGSLVIAAVAATAGPEAGQPPIKLNIPNPKSNRRKQAKIKFSSMVPAAGNQAAQCGDYSANNATFPARQASSTGYSGASGTSGAETTGNESKRASKRKRIPKKFYGDSSDEEQHQQNQYPKWRRVDNNPDGLGHHQGTQQQGQHQYVPTITIKQNFGPPLQSKWYNAEQQANLVVYKNESAPSTHGASVTDTEDPVETSSESSVSEAEEPAVPEPSADDQLVKRQENNYTIPGPAVTGDKKHLYCYCQCPYDEVSEMIACDGSHCKIEWFHFECVGIMVPPKGKWYCPDCLKEDPTLKNDDFID